MKNKMEQQEITKALKTIEQALELAQKRGVFSLKDSALIVAAMETLTRFCAPIEYGRETVEDVKHKDK